MSHNNKPAIDGYKIFVRISLLLSDYFLSVGKSKYASLIFEIRRKEKRGLLSRTVIQVDPELTGENRYLFLSSGFRVKHGMTNR